MQVIVIILALILALTLGAGSEKKPRVKNTVGVKVEIGTEGTSAEVSVGVKDGPNSANIKVRKDLP